MIKRVMLSTCLSIVSIIQTMDIVEGVDKKRKKDPNLSLSCAIVNNPYDIKSIKELLSLGADPNYVSPMYKTTPLMKAVRMSNPVLATLFLQWGANVNMTDLDGRPVRDFNIIYHKHTIIPLVNCIVRYISKVASYDNPPLDYKSYAYFYYPSRMLRNGLLIDKMLENRGALTTVKPEEHPLLGILQDKDTKRIVRYALRGDRYQKIKSRVPSLIYEALRKSQVMT